MKGMQIHNGYRPMQSWIISHVVFHDFLDSKIAALCKVYVRSCSFKFLSKLLTLNIASQWYNPCMQPPFS